MVISLFITEGERDENEFWWSHGHGWYVPLSLFDSSCLSRKNAEKAVRLASVCFMCYIYLWIVMRFVYCLVCLCLISLLAAVNDS